MLGAEAPCGAAPGGEVRDWELWAAATVTPSSRQVSKDSAKSRKRAIIGGTPSTVPWPLLLTTDGVENKASVPFRPASRAHCPLPPLGSLWNLMAASAVGTSRW